MLKLIKTKLRTMSQNRLEDLMKISCVHNININSEYVILLLKAKSSYLAKCLNF